MDDKKQAMLNRLRKKPAESFTPIPQDELVEKMRKAASETTFNPPPKLSYAPPEKAKPPKPRNCCASTKPGPHLPDCQTLAPPKPKRPLARWLPPGWRWPTGTQIVKTWDGISWACAVTSPGKEAILLFGKNSWNVEQVITKKYLEMVTETENKQ